MMKMINFWGDLTDVSSEKEALTLSLEMLLCTVKLTNFQGGLAHGLS